MAGLAQHPQLRRHRIDTPNGKADVVDVAAIRSGRAEPHTRVPGLGEHDDAIRREFSED